MAKFQYRMQNILDIKSKLEIQAKNAYTVANNKYMEEQQKLQQLIIKRMGYEKQLKEAISGNIDIKEVNAKNTSIVHIIGSSSGRIKFAIKASNKKIFIADAQVINPKSIPELSNTITS